MEGSNASDPEMALRTLFSTLRTLFATEHDAMETHLTNPLPLSFQGVATGEQESGPEEHAQDETGPNPPEPTEQNLFELEVRIGDEVVRIPLLTSAASQVDTHRIQNAIRSNMMSYRDVVANDTPSSENETEGESENADNDDDGTLIPCELCDQMVNFTQYTAHTQVCLRRQQMYQRRLQHQLSVPRFGFGGGGLEENQTPWIQQALERIGFRVLQSTNPTDEYEFNLLLRDFIGEVPVGVRDASAVTKAVPCEELAEALDEENCSICQEELKKRALEENAVVRETVCHHRFCEPCIYKWLENSKKCPNCFKVLE